MNKIIATLIAAAFAVSTIAAETTKVPATPATSSVPTVAKDEKKPVKSDTKSGDKKAVVPTAPAPAASK